MERAITEILYMVSQGKTLEVALYTVLSNYTMTRNDNAVMVVNHSWEEDLMMYLKRKTIEGASRKTLENYKYVIRCVLETINKPTKEITSDDLQLYIMYKKNVSGSSEKYLLDIRTKLNGFFAWACKTKVIDFNPMDAVAHIGGLFNARFPDSKTRRGRVIDEGDTSPTIVCCGDEIVRIESMDEYRIRKLTPTECGRLMNVNDRDIGSILSVNSNSQGYKQFGNSIVVAVLIAVFSQLHIAGVKTWNEMTDDERYSLIYKDCEVGK